jgi:exodeoxyribonuclease VII large subunit
MDEARNNLLLSVSDFIALTNQTLEFAYPTVAIEGEVASFKVNQGKWVFFDLKDAEGSVGCFMSVYQLRVPLEDGMKVVVSASPKLTQWGKFSLTVRAVRPLGEGAIKKSFDILKAKLDAEGLFAPERKRPLPPMPRHVGVISSTQAAGYADFIKIIDDRWGGVRVDVAHVQVQGEAAADQIIQAIKYFNEQADLPEVLVVIRGGGSADDLAVFNDELLVREIAASRVPTLVGVGHEVDTTLADLAADVRAATPSNAAQLLVPDRAAIIAGVQAQVRSIVPRLDHAIDMQRTGVQDRLARAVGRMTASHELQEQRLAAMRRTLAGYDPGRILARGYALVRGEVAPGSNIEIEREHDVITAEVQDVRHK